MMKKLQYTCLLASYMLMNVHGAGDNAQKFVDVAGQKHPVPQPIFDPGPQYADANRKFGIASSITRSPGGRLWCGWSSGGQGEGRENFVIVVTSDDDGKTWTPPRIVIDSRDERGGKIRTDHLTVWTTPSGQVWIMWSEYPRGLEGPHSSQWCIVSDNPDDDEPRWSAPRKLVDGQNLLTTPTVLRDGTWIFPSGCWHGYNNLEKRKAHPSRPILSSDNGKTFSLGGPLQLAKNDFDEYMIVERKDGTLVAFNRHATSFLQCESTNQGKTWSEQKTNGIPHTNSRFVFMGLASGHWLLVKHGNLDGVSNAIESKHSGNRGRSHLTAFLSKDEGKTWGGGFMLDERPCSYPYGYQTDDGTIYISYERNRWNQPEILMARFTEEDVLAGKRVSDKAALQVLVNKATGSKPLP